MKRLLFHRFLYTSITFGLAFATLVAAVFWRINVFELPRASIIGIEQTEVGELAIAFLLVIPAFFVDRVVARQRAHESQLHAEQLRVMRVTMRTVQDIVNNNLNQLQLLRMEAEGRVPDETLTQFDATIQDTAAQLEALGNMKVFAERTMEIGPGLDVQPIAAPKALVAKA